MTHLIRIELSETSGVIAYIWLIFLLNTMFDSQLRHSLLSVVFIIVIIGIIWLFIGLFLFSCSVQEGKQKTPLIHNQTSFEGVTYLERIDNFSLQVFDIKAELSYFVKAKSYFSFKNLPVLLIEPKVTFYDAKGIKNYVLNSKRAHYVDNNGIKFKGEVGIHFINGFNHKINTEELLVGIETRDLMSKKQVTYLGETVKIISQGIQIRSKDDIIKLIGNIKINQRDGQQILTKDLYINQIEGQKHFYSKNKIVYMFQKDKIYADGIDINEQEQIIELLGKVKIMKDSGSKISTKNLFIDQSNGLEIYRTKEKVHYQSNTADIHAVGMIYDVIKQKIKLTSDVIGIL